MKGEHRGVLLSVVFLCFVVMILVMGVENLIESDYEWRDKEEVEQFVVDSHYTECVNCEVAVVERVVDGDTIVLADGRKVRYIGIDTPESVDPRKEVECYGLEASFKNKELVEGKQVWLEKDVNESDRYGRILRYVWILGSELYLDGKSQESSVQEVMVNELLVRQGFAVASAYPPDVKYQEKFEDVEQVAREGGVGLWGECDNEVRSKK